MALLLTLVAISWTGLLLAFAKPLRRYWLEPVLKRPVLILESDDWGAGPLAQAAALNGIVEVLGSLKNRSGEHPVMTIGLVLEVADRAAVQRLPVPSYSAITLADISQQPVLDALRAGVETHVFALQVHGLSHYWPATLMATRESDERVRRWFEEDGIGWTETLPDPVQSRWIDARTLPSTPLPTAEMEASTQNDAHLWRTLFEHMPMVAVPTTFIWNADVERIWADAGIRVIVTPGRRYVGRDSTGRPGPVDREMVNGDRGDGGQLYLVRDVYFEPALGHSATRLAAATKERFFLGRPALVETHRFNFCGPSAIPNSREVLAEGLRIVLDEIPEVRFMSTAALAQIISAPDTAWIECDARRRIAVWLRRIREIPRFRKAATLCGLMVPLWILEQAVA